MRWNQQRYHLTSRESNVDLPSSDANTTERPESVVAGVMISSTPVELSPSQLPVRSSPASVVGVVDDLSSSDSEILSDDEDSGLDSDSNDDNWRAGVGTRSSDVTRSSTAVAKATGELFALAASPAVTSQDTVRVPVDKEGSRDQMDFTGSLLGKFLGLTQYFPLSCSMSSPSDKLLDLLRNHFPSGGSVISVAEPVPVLFGRSRSRCKKRCEGYNMFFTTF